MSCEFYLRFSILVSEMGFCKYPHFTWKYSVSLWTEYFLYRSPNREFHYLFECILLFHDSMQSTKEGVVLFIWMYFLLPWLYVEHQRRCCTIYLNVSPSVVIICIASNKVFKYLFGCILLWCDSIEGIKECAALFIWMNFMQSIE